jgi:hypothetical protein
MNNIKDFIYEFPKYLNLTNTDTIVAFAIDAYERFYKPIEDWDYISDEEEPSLTDIQKACLYITSYFAHCSSHYTAILDHLKDLLEYRLINIINIESEDVGKYDKLMDNIKTKDTAYYTFPMVEVTFDKVVNL